MHGSSRSIGALAFCLVPIFALGVEPNWVLQGSTPKTDFYIDLDSLKINGTLRRIWELHDMKTPQQGFRSSRHLSEYDCQEERWRILQQYTYVERMGSGPMSNNSHYADQWSYIAPGTAGADILKLVCAKK